MTDDENTSVFPLGTSLYVSRVHILDIAVHDEMTFCSFTTFCMRQNHVLELMLVSKRPGLFRLVADEIRV